MILVKNRFDSEVIGEFDISPKANLRRADLRLADLRETKYNVLNILQCNWKENISNQLCAKMMAFDRDSHPNPEGFLVWSQGGYCPLNSANVERALIFNEKRELYNHSLASPTPWELWEMIAREFEIKI